MPLKPEQQAKFNLVCERIAGGMGLKSACEIEGTPDFRTAIRWLNDDKDESGGMSDA